MPSNVFTSLNIMFKLPLHQIGNKSELSAFWRVVYNMLSSGAVSMVNNLTKKKTAYDLELIQWKLLEILSLAFVNFQLRKGSRADLVRHLK